MGDSYRPGGDGRGRYQGSAVDRMPERGYRPRGYDPHPPSSHYNDARQPPPSSYHDPSRNPRGSDFTFRGAAGGQSYMPEQDFTFRAPGPEAPNGFAPDGPRRDRERPKRFNREGRAPRHDARSRGQGGQSRGRGGHRGFGPRPAHDRDILNKMAEVRDTTPERLHGMKEEGSRFKNLDELSDSDFDSDDAPRKRAKVEPSPSAPKWSNPDPYTALPPPDTLGGPKKDIVQVIRKAKNEQAAKDEGRDKVADNSDFIAFKFDDDDENDAAEDEEDSDEDRDTNMDGVPAKSPVQTGEPSFSHRDAFHRKTSSSALPAAGGQSPSSFTPINQRTHAQPPVPGSTEYGGPPPRPLGEMQFAEPQSPIVPEPVSRAPKRKSRDTHQYGDVVEEWQVVDGQPTTPWYQTDHSASIATGWRLHKEICDFFEYVKPRPFEEVARRDLIARVKAAICSFTGGGGSARNAEVHCFGSFASGLYLPTADMDLVVLSQSFLSGGPREIGQSTNQLRMITQHIEKLGVAKSNTATFIAKSKVPIVKFTDKLTGIKVDISFENTTGFPAIKTFEAWKAQYPALPVLVALVKQLLAMRGLNEVFSGGIGGFTTICMATHVLQTVPELQAAFTSAHHNYGEMFMKFLDFYANKIDIGSTGIIMYAPFHYDKIKNPNVSQNKDRLTVIDPNNRDNDISGGSRMINTVLNRFRNAHSELQRHMAQLFAGKISSSSILECVIGGNYQAVESQRELLRSLYGNTTRWDVPALPDIPFVPPGVKDTPLPRANRSKRPARRRQQATERSQLNERAISNTEYVAPHPDNYRQFGGNYYNGTLPPAPTIPIDLTYPFTYNLYHFAELYGSARDDPVAAAVAAYHCEQLAEICRLVWEDVNQTDMPQPFGYEHCPAVIDSTEFQQRQQVSDRASTARHSPRSAVPPPPPSTTPPPPPPPETPPPPPPCTAPPPPPSTPPPPPPRAEIERLPLSPASSGSASMDLSD